ncbi:MAG: cell envelope integrity protein CreD [Pseudomonadota bacterium]
MKNPILLKCALLALISALLLIPLAMIERTIAERTAYRADAIHAIAASTAGAQSIVGPVFTVAVEEEFDEEKSYEYQGEPKKKMVRSKRTHTLTVVPKELHFDGALAVERRAYGLHETAVFELQSAVTGTFETPSTALLPALGANARLSWGTPTLAVGIADPRGLSGEPKIQLDGKPMALHRAAHISGMETGFHGTSDLVLDGKVTRLPFRIDLRLTGTGSVGFVPLGDVTTTELRGNWPHPSFGGDFLPRTHETSKEGFVARWSTTGLASSANADEINGAAKGFEVRLIDPVDVYRQALRAVKYGVLFVVLTFAAFFMFENLKSLQIHPIQYALVGLAQAVFFLLLTSLSEHIPFAMAYLAAASASIALIGIYLAAILQGWRRGLGFSLALATLYAALFGILRSEQSALLLGSLLLFFALAGLMLGTRRIDWYGLNTRTPLVDTAANP